MTTITELKKLLFSMILKTPIWLVHLAANQSSVMSIPTTIKHSKTRRSKKMRNKMKNVSIMYLNIRGLKSKLESLKEIIDEQKPDIIVL